MPGRTGPWEKGFDRNGDGADRSRAEVADNDANLIGSRQHVDLPLKDHPGFAKKFVLFLLEVYAKVPFVAHEDVAARVALDKCHVQCPLLTIAGFLQQKLHGVEANLQLEVACGKRSESLAADHHAETGGFDGARSRKPQCLFHGDFGIRADRESVIASAITEMRAFGAHLDLELAELAVPLTMVGIEAEAASVTAIVKGVAHGLADIVGAVKRFAAGIVGEEAGRIASVLSFEKGGGVRRRRSSTLVGTDAATDFDAVSIDCVNGHVDAIQSADGAIDNLRLRARFAVNARQLIRGVASARLRLALARLGAWIAARSG